MWECPDLFALKDADGKTKWVLFVSINPGGPQGGSATQYFVGHFDGKNFNPQDDKVRWLDYGPDNYAGVTWSDIPAADGRRLFIGWMSNWQYANVVPTEKWRSATTLPREIILNKKDDGYELISKPAKEVLSILSNPVQYSGKAVIENAAVLVSFENAGGYAFSLSFSNDAGDKVVIVLEDNELTFDRSHSGMDNFSSVFAAVHKVDIENVVVNQLDVYMDEASIEIFVNNGERVATEIIFPTNPYTQVELNSKDSKFTVSSVQAVME